MEFEKNDMIFSESIGVCKVTDIVNLMSDKQYIKYYVLTPIIGRGNSPSYIPVYNHQVLLRPLISPAEAKAKEALTEISELEKQEIKYVLEGQ